jgi:hypothetical protein
MGNNDSLPPPPSPGSTPDLPPTPPSAVVPPPPLSGGSVPPPAPPAVPQFPPTEPMPVQPGSPDLTPTTQMPSTFAQPAQAQPYAGQPAAATGGGTPPGGVPPTGQPPASGGGANKLPWIIAAAVGVVAIVVVAVVLLTGDDNTTSSPGTTTLVSESSVSASSTTVVPSTTLVPETTLVITTPTTTASTSTPTTAQPGVKIVADDTNTFTVLMLDTFQVDTSPTIREGVTLANVTGSEDVATFLAGTNLDLFGVAVSVGPTAQLPTADELLTSADPGDSVCSNRAPLNDYPTQLGTAQVLLLDGCGTDGLAGQVAMVLPIGGTDLTMLVYVRGPGPSNTDLIDFAQAVAESVVIL